MSITLFQLLSSAAFALLLVYSVIPLLIRFAYHKNLYDKPDGERKIHDRFVPSLGGVALFAAILLGFSLSGYADQIDGYPYFAAALGMLFLTGLKDDMVGLKPAKKLLVEIPAALIVIFGSGFLIDNLYGFLGIHALPVWVSMPLTVFVFIVVMNAYNLIDGIDGLAAGVGVLASFLFGIVFWISGVYEMAVLSLFVGVALLGFLIHNFRPASIFMGDSGSLVIGFLLGILAVNFIGLGENSAYVDTFGNTSAILPAIFLVIPLFDTLRVFIKRVIKRRSPFSPGTDHIHHVLLSYGLSHSKASLYLYASMCGIALFSFAFITFDPHVVLLSAGFASLLLLPTNGIKRSLLSRMGLKFSSKELIDTNKKSSGPANPKDEKREKEATTLA